MAHKSLLPKQRCLTDHETQTSFDAWRESMVFHISLSDKSTRFLSTGDLKTWSTAADRGFGDDGDVGAAGITADNKMNRQAKVALLNIILGSIASYSPVISSKFVKNQSTSLESIWNRLRSYYGFRRAGSRILELPEVKLELDESRESLWERLYSFVEDQLLTKDGVVQHDNIKREEDEEFTPTLLNILVTIWLQAINPSLPALIKQRFATQLRSSTVYSLREEISDSIPNILSELDEKECGINRAGAYQKKQARGGYQSGYQYRNQGGYQYRNQSSYQGSKRKCSLCAATGKTPVDHFLSTCPYLSPEDKKYISKTREITLQEDADASEFDNDCERQFQDAASRRLNVRLQSAHIAQGGGDQEPQMSACNSTVYNMKDIKPKAVNIRKVDVFASPTMDTIVNNSDSKWTLDSGAEANVITEEECFRLGLEIRPTDQTATQGDGKTPLPAIGEVHFVAVKGHHRLFFNGLVVEDLDVPVLAGMPFHIVNNIQINYSQKVIIIDDCCRIGFDTKKRSRNADAPRALRVARQTCVLPGEGLSFKLPEELCGDDIVAIEPRTTVPKDMPDWIQCELVRPDAEGCVTIENMTTEPVLIGRHTQVCQARHTTTADLEVRNQSPPAEIINKTDSKFNVNSSIIMNTVTSLSNTEREIFKAIHEDYSSVFSPGIGCYNNYSGDFTHIVNMSPNLPPQRRGRIPNYSKEDKGILQDKFDYLLSEGVLTRAEDVNQPVEFVHPSFLIKKSSGGHRLVTSFGEMADYCRPQPTINSNIEHALHQIGQFKEMIITDFKDSYYQIPLDADSARYVGVITPFTGTYVYRRSVMGLPGSEAALEELLSRIFGDLIKEGKMVKIADDMFLGSQSVNELAVTWKEVLQRLHLNGLKLSPSKTKICPTSASILGWEWKNGSIQPGKHRINALMSCEPPGTVKGLRSYLGCYKYISRVLPKYSEVLHPLEDAVAGKQSADKITWSEELLSFFNISKNHLRKIEPIILPKRDDQLHIVTDASATGIAGTMFVLRDDKPAVAGFFSAALKQKQSKLITCELEALSIATNIKHFSYQIIQSTKKARILTDSKPCCLAYKKLLRGEFSSSPKVTTFLSIASRYSVEMLHISGSSNLFSDFASRNPVKCNSPNCSVCIFIDDSCNSSVGEIKVSDVLSGKMKVPFSTKSSWRTVQQSCPDLVKVHKYLTTGASVPKKNRKLTDVKKYMNFGITVLSGRLEGLLAIKHSTPFKPVSLRVIIPRAVSDGLLTALHIQLNHPTANQLKLVFSREFFCLDLTDKAKEVTERCYTCAALKNIPSAYHEQSTSIPANTIASKFSSDVVKRFSQLILLMREDITSYTEATIIENEKADTLRNGLILLASRLRSLQGHKAIIRTDPGTGLQTLHKDRSLSKFNLEVELGEAKNINKNPIAESAIKELHAELVRLQPRGGKITETTLAKAINSMNNIIRHNKLSSREAWTKRDMSTGEELTVDDGELIKQKYDQRCSSHKSSAAYKARGKPAKPLPEVKTGQLAHIYSDRSKLHIRDKYLVTAVEEKDVTLQKFTKNQFRNKEYRVKKSDLILLPSDNKIATDVNDYKPDMTVRNIDRKVESYRVPSIVPQVSDHPTDSSDDSDDDDYTLCNRLKLFLSNREQRHPTTEEVGDIDDVDYHDHDQQELRGPHDVDINDTNTIVQENNVRNPDNLQQMREDIAEDEVNETDDVYQGYAADDYQEENPQQTRGYKAGNDGATEPTRPSRNTRPPAYLSDYVTGDRKKK